MSEKKRMMCFKMFVFMWEEFKPKKVSHLTGHREKGYRLKKKKKNMNLRLFGGIISVFSFVPFWNSSGFKDRGKTRSSAGLKIESYSYWVTAIQAALMRRLPPCGWNPKKDQLLFSHSNTTTTTKAAYFKNGWQDNKVSLSLILWILPLGNWSHSRDVLRSPGLCKML